MRRHVFFIAGFDPRGARGYYERLGEAASIYAEISAEKRIDLFSTIWTWRALHENALTTVEFLHWDDIVDRHWRSKGRMRAQVAAVRALMVYRRAGLLDRARDGARAVRWALLVMGIFPVALALASLAFALSVSTLAQARWPYSAWLGLPALVVVWRISDWAWRALNLEWLARGFACIIETAKGEAPGWAERCSIFAARIAAVEAEGRTDEIVVIGHSLGAILAASALGQYLSLGQRPRRPVILMTLGNIIPFYTWIERNREILREAELVAASPLVRWIDVTSGSDPASACRMGALAGGVGEVKRWEPEFHRILTPARFRYIRRRPLDFHFQYLKRADRADGFDLIRMMCSAKAFLADAPP